MVFSQMLHIEMSKSPIAKTQNPNSRMAFEVQVVGKLFSQKVVLPHDFAFSVPIKNTKLTNFIRSLPYCVKKNGLSVSKI